MADLRRFYSTTRKRDPKEAETRLAHLDAFFTGRRAVGIGWTGMSQYVELRQGQAAANGTINRELNARADAPARVQDWQKFPGAAGRET